jgi:flagellar protein FliO/FliZ
MTIRPALTTAGAAVLGCLLLAPAAFAADGESTPLNIKSTAPAAKHAASPGSGGMVRTIVGLAVVIAVIYGLHWVLKQVKASKDDRASGNGLTPLATLPLGGNRSLALVRAGREVVLVGVGEGAVTPIRTYGEDEARELGLVVDAPPAAEPAAADAGSATTPGHWWSAAVVELRRRTVIR